MWLITFYYLFLYPFIKAMVTIFFFCLYIILNTYIVKMLLARVLSEVLRNNFSYLIIDKIIINFLCSKWSWKLKILGWIKQGLLYRLIKIKSRYSRPWNRSICQYGSLELQFHFFYCDIRLYSIEKVNII